MTKRGTVYLIGAGPGDPGLMTLRGRDILETADVIIYDYLVNPKLLGLAREDADVIYVGKKAGVKEKTQREINSLLVKHARGGKIVARLKGGDPFIFGRGGEEAEALSNKDIPYEIVPGATSASAVPAYAGIPLTHRDVTSSFAVVTGHEDPSKEESNIPWKALAGIGTVVFLMGVRTLGKNMKKLIEAGKPEDTPAAVITWGTYPYQSTVTGNIASIAKLADGRKGITSPAIVVVGDVVRIRDVINWYESKPLFGRNIIVTRTKQQAPAFTGLLEAEGARVIEFPAIVIAPPRSYKALDKAIENIGQYDWLIFTSSNGVSIFFDRISLLHKDIRDLHGIKIAAIGEVTAGEIEKRGIKVELTPEDYRAEGLIELFKKRDVKGKRVLIPRAKEAREILPESLGRMGATVDVVTAYETKKPGKKKAEAIRKMLEAGEIDAVTFTSSSTVRNFISVVGGLYRRGRKPVTACIGPITAETLKKEGCKADIVPSEYTTQKLTDEMVRYFKKQ